MKRRFKIFLAGLAALTALVAQANDSESAVPLTIGGMARNPLLAHLSISLDGDQVDFAGDLDNTSAAPQSYGFFAYTPLFERLGEAETYDDKSFGDLTVSLGTQPVKVIADRRAFFLGKDITASLKSVGLDPLPDADDDPKLIARLSPQFGFPLKGGQDWQGFVSYSWTATVPPMTKRTLDVRYKALPQFSLEDIASARFSSLVRRHCGNSERVGHQIEQVAPGATSVVMQRYVIPVSYIDRTAFHLSVTQPAKDWLGARPILVLACGLPDSQAAARSVSGTIEDIDSPLSILVISKPALP